MKNAITYKQFKQAIKIVNEYKRQLEEHYKNVNNELDGELKFVNVKKETLIYETEISNRLLRIIIQNCNKINISQINSSSSVEQLSGLSISKFLQCRLVGKKTLQELKDLCFYADVKLMP